MQNICDMVTSIIITMTSRIDVRPTRDRYAAACVLSIPWGGTCIRQNHHTWMKTAEMRSNVREISY